MPNQTASSSCIAIAACRVELARTAPTELRLVPAGHFRARDGRPTGIATGWHLDAAGAAKVIAAAKRQQDDLVIDYEHQTLHSDTNGKPAPAAGWFSPQNLEWRPDGLYATGVEWTAAAKAAIEGGEYRYLSPVIAYDRATGAVNGLQMAALVNYAAIDGLNGLTARAAAKFSFPTEDSTVDRAQLIALYGLPADATDDAILAACKAALDDAKETAALKTEVAALKAKADSADPAKFVPLATFEALKADLAALKNQSVAKEVDDLVKSGTDTGKLVGDQATWARELGMKDIAALKTYLDKTPAIAALKGTQSGGKEPAQGAGAVTLTESQIAICKATGIDTADYQKQLDKEKA